MRHLPALLLLLVACGRSGDVVGTAAPESLDLTPVLEHAIAVQQAPGAIVGIRSADGEFQVATAGLADLDSGRPMTLNDPWFLGSITKTYTATVILQLADEGRLELDQSLAVTHPAFPGSSEITLRQLLEHTSGLGDFAVWAYFRPDREEMLGLLTREWTVEEMLSGAAEMEPMFAPGEDWAYSNTNYLLLAAVAEAVGGETLARQIRHRILEPLGLERSWLNRWEEAPTELPITGYLGPLPFWGHSEMFGELGPTTEIDQGNFEWGAGGMVSTAVEAITFLDALLAGELTSQASLEAMLAWTPTPALGAPGPDTPADIDSAYGLGIARQTRPGYSMIGHGGLYNGHTAGLWRLEECETTIALYFNRGFIDARWVMDRVVEALECTD